VEQDHARRGGIPAFDIVKVHSVALDEDANRWISSLSGHLKCDIAKYQNDKPGQNDQQDGFSCGHRSTLRWSALARYSTLINLRPRREPAPTQPKANKTLVGRA
jgi:hypothetical protein